MICNYENSSIAYTACTYMYVYESYALKSGLITTASFDPGQPTLSIPACQRTMLPNDSAFFCRCFFGVAECPGV